jgi:PKD repeat protein
MISSGFKIYKGLAIVAAIGLLGLSNCKPPEEPFDNVEDPVFSLTGTVDGKPLQLMAGVDDYYMFTSYEIPFTDSIFRFSGKLEKVNCNNCEAIEVIISDVGKLTGASPTDIDKALSSTITFDDPVRGIDKKYTVSFVAQDSGFINPKYLWRFSVLNNDSSTLRNPTFTFDDASPKNVCLTVSDGNCSRTICNEFNPFKVDEGDSVPPGFDYIIDRTVQFKNTSFGLSYLWEFGDGTTSTAYNPEHVYALPGLYTVCLTVNTVANTHKYCKLINISDPFFTCLANMEYKNPLVTIIPPAFISKTIIRYTDDNGDVYESNLAEQPPGSFFNILSHNNYQPNERGEKTQQVNMSFKCRVFNANGNFKDIEITNGTIAVAYP